MKLSPEDLASDFVAIFLFGQVCEHKSQWSITPETIPYCWFSLEGAFSTFGTHDTVPAPTQLVTPLHVLGTSHYPPHGEESNSLVEFGWRLGVENVLCAEQPNRRMRRLEGSCHSWDCFWDGADF